MRHARKTSWLPTSVAGQNRCRITRGCGLQAILKEAVEAFLAILDRYSLADVVRKRLVLVEILGLGILRDSVQLPL